MDNKSKILKLPGLDYFGSWEVLQRFLEKRGNPPYEIIGDLYLKERNIESLGNLVYVGGDINF
jgi:hypothetical protein